MSRCDFPAITDKCSFLLALIWSIAPNLNTISVSAFSKRNCPLKLDSHLSESLTNLFLAHSKGFLGSLHVRDRSFIMPEELVG
jgi:hypothetical protein